MCEHQDRVQEYLERTLAVRTVVHADLNLQERIYRLLNFEVSRESDECPKNVDLLGSGLQNRVYGVGNIYINDKELFLAVRIPKSPILCISPNLDGSMHDDWPMWEDLESYVGGFVQGDKGPYFVAVLSVPIPSWRNRNMAVILTEDMSRGGRTPLKTIMGDNVFMHRIETDGSKTRVLVDTDEYFGYPVGGCSKFLQESAVIYANLKS